MEKVQKENDGCLTRKEKQNELSKFCKKHTHDESCPLYSYCKEVQAPFVLLTDLEIDRLYKEVKVANQEAKADVAYGKDYIPTYKRLNQEAKADAGKLPMNLVPTQIVRDIAQVRQYGNEKYGDPDNWRNVEKLRYVAALERHLLAYKDYLNGDDDGVDKESGINHYKHMACNIAFICEMERWEKCHE